MANLRGERATMTLSELLPGAFEPCHMPDAPAP
jgi:hypothetical protein